MRVLTRAAKRCLYDATREASGVGEKSSFGDSSVQHCCSQSCLVVLCLLKGMQFLPKQIFLFILQPKCGFIPSSSAVTHEMKHKVCRYCMHQHLKVSAGQPTRLQRCGEGAGLQ